MTDPKLTPIEADLLKQLNALGYAIVPIVPSKNMCIAALFDMRRYHYQNGRPTNAPFVSNMQKAAMRYNEMLKASPIKQDIS